MLRVFYSLALSLSLLFWFCLLFASLFTYFLLLFHLSPPHRHSSLAPFYCVFSSSRFLLFNVVSFFSILPLVFFLSRFPFVVYFIGSYVRVFSRFLFVCVCVPFASFCFVSFNKLHFLLAKFIRFFASVSFSSFTNSRFFPLDSSSNDFSFYVLFSRLLYTQSHLISLFYFYFTFHSQVSLHFHTVIFYLFLLYSGNFSVSQES